MTILAVSLCWAVGCQAVMMREKTKEGCGAMYLLWPGTIREHLGTTSTQKSLSDHFIPIAHNAPVSVNNPPSFSRKTLRMQLISSSQTISPQLPDSSPDH